tara:strand:+ start:229 stop:387 length:159 start_codon:yes stop_codon:yes gene_type:complete
MTAEDLITLTERLCVTHQQAADLILNLLEEEILTDDQVEAAAKKLNIPVWED